MVLDRVQKIRVINIQYHTTALQAHLDAALETSRAGTDVNKRKMARVNELHKITAAFKRRTERLRLT